MALVWFEKGLDVDQVLDLYLFLQFIWKGYWLEEWIRFEKELDVDQGFWLKNSLIFKWYLIY